jgi:exopolysaccharide biosynthesis polyprenyl glycosylphosphotransferase
MIPRRFFWLFDLLTLVIVFIAAYALIPHVAVVFRPGGVLRVSWLSILELPSVGEGKLPPFSESLWILSAMVPTALLVLGLLGNHGSLLKKSRTRIVSDSMLTAFAGLSVIVLVMFALKIPNWSRLLIFFYALMSGITLGAYRLVLRLYLVSRKAAGYYRRNVLFVGLPTSIQWMSRYFAEEPAAEDYQLLGYLRVVGDNASSNGNRGRDSSIVAGLPVLGNVEELGDLLIHRPVHEVIAIHPISGGDWIQQVVKNCDYFSVPLRIVPEALLLYQQKSLRLLYHAEHLHLPAVVLTRPHSWDSEALFFKRLFDIIVSGILLVFLFPLLALIAVAIKFTTPNLPILYPWRVVGRNGVEFTGYKFTTMIQDADDIKPDLMQYNEMTGPVFKMKHDPRITRLGHFLRRYSLNELPQLWSVLKGDMSLVGPRPAFRHELERYEFWHKRKLVTQPGITCLWQVNGRNKISDFDDWINMDLYYIDNWSLWLDLKILVRTARVVLTGTGW